MNQQINIGIVAAEFNYDITFAMVELAKEHAKFLDANISKVVKVPGVFDMPLAVKKMISRDDIDCIVTLGTVIEGQTEHDEIVIQHTTMDQTYEIFFRPRLSSEIQVFFLRTYGSDPDSDIAMEKNLGCSQG